MASQLPSPGNPRPSWVPRGFDWYFGEQSARLNYLIEEAQHADSHQVGTLCRMFGVKASKAAVYRWLTQKDYNVRLVFRNTRHAVAICVSHTHPEIGTTILCAGVCPSYASQPYFQHLLRLAYCELPERPLIWTIKAKQESLAEQLRSWGWKATHCDAAEDDTEAEYTFTFGPFVRYPERTR